MRILWQALRATTIESLGILLVVWLLFGAPTWAFQWAVDPSVGNVAVSTWFGSLQESIARTLASTDADEDRIRYADEKLDFYSQVYRHAATGYVQRVTE